MIRVRFAPSPTGNLHIGSLRTALFNWLFAQHFNGDYVLRVEDTDLMRSRPEFEENILSGLQWMGLHMDEGPGVDGNCGPYRQSERMAQNLYINYANQLLKSGAAYRCFCSEDELALEKEQEEAASKPYIYSRKCLNLSAQETEALIAQGHSFVIRFKVPVQEKLTYTDLIRGDIVFDLSLFSDFVLLKSDSGPSYNFAVVIDDMLMKITHVIRGEDHISNTPKQICLYRALSYDLPQFAHLPIILGTDRSKLSKRHGATSVTEYAQMGYLPEALFNYLILLGWSAPDGREILSREEMIAMFSLDRVAKSGAIFDMTKLNWMNGQYIRQQSRERLAQLTQPYIELDQAQRLTMYSPQQISDIIYSFRDNLELLSDINKYLNVYLFSDEEYEQHLREFSFSEQDKEVFRLFAQKLTDIEHFRRPALDEVLHSLLVSTGLGKGKVFKPLRLICTGLPSGPDLIDFMVVLGREAILKRLFMI